MAGFRTHITVSTLAGIGYGGVAYTLYGVPPAACLLAGGLCSVSGMLPDIDSGPGRPLRESLAFAAAVVSTMMVDRFQQFQWPMDGIILAAAAVYLFVRFGAAEVLQRFTVHRGMFHSLPAAAIFGEAAFLLASGSTELRLYKAGAVVVGYLSHLILDELYSVEYVRGLMTFKRSFGTAIKIYGRGFMPNAATYGLLACMSFLAMQEPTWMNQHREELAERTSSWTQNLASRAQRRVDDPVESGRAVPASAGNTTSVRNATDWGGMEQGGGDRLREPATTSGRSPASAMPVRSGNTNTGRESGTPRTERWGGLSDDLNSSSPRSGGSTNAPAPNRETRSSRTTPATDARSGGWGAADVGRPGVR